MKYMLNGEKITKEDYNRKISALKSTCSKYKIQKIGTFRNICTTTKIEKEYDANGLPKTLILSKYIRDHMSDSVLICERGEYFFDSLRQSISVNGEITNTITMHNDLEEVEIVTINDKVISTKITPTIEKKYVGFASSRGNGWSAFREVVSSSLIKAIQPKTIYNKLVVKAPVKKKKTKKAFIEDYEYEV